jgi:hypothetical protein
MRSHLCAVGTPSQLSTISCVGSTSQAGLNVRVAELVVCHIQSMDQTGAAAIATPEDFSAPLVVGGVNLTAVVSTGNSSVLSFTVVAPSALGSPFSVTGHLSNGTAFAQGALALSVGTLLFWDVFFSFCC